MRLLSRRSDRYKRFPSETCSGVLSLRTFAVQSRDEFQKRFFSSRTCACLRNSSSIDEPQASYVRHRRARTVTNAGWYKGPSRADTAGKKEARTTSHHYPPLPTTARQRWPRKKIETPSASPLQSRPKRPIRASAGRRRAEAEAEAACGSPLRLPPPCHRSGPA